MNLLTTGMSFLFPLITFPYLARVLRASGYGSVEYAISTAQFFALFALLGMNLYGTRECARVRNNPTELSKTTQELLIVLSISTLLVSVCYIAAIMAFPSFNESLGLFAIAGLTIPFTTIGVEWFMKANEEFSFITIRTFITRVLVVVLMFALVRSPDDLIVWAAISVLCSGIANVANFIYLIRNISMQPLRSLNLIRHFKPMILFFAASAAISIYTSLDTVMLGAMAGEEEVAYYRVAIKIKGLMVAVMSALANVLIARTSYLAFNDEVEYYSILGKSVKVATLFSFYAVPMVTILASPIIMFLAGSGYEAAIIVTQAVMPAVACISFTQITANEIMAPLGKERGLTISYAIAGAVDLILNIMVIPVYGAVGAAVSTTVAESFVLVLQLFMVRKSVSIREIAQGAKKDAAVALAAAASAFVVFVMLGQSIVAAVASIAISLVVFLAGLYFIKEELFLKLIHSKEKHSDKKTK